MTKQKTPQEKKALSYKKDRRNVYGASDKASRKSIPIRKSKQNRAYRKKANQILSKVENESETEEIELLENEIKTLNKGDWAKTPDAPLGEVVEDTLRNRKLSVGRGKTARKKEREVTESLEIKAHQESEDIWVAEVKGLEEYKVRGRTENEAIGKAKYIVKAAAQNASGRDTSVVIDGKIIEPVLKTK